MPEELEFLSRSIPPPAYEIRDLGLLDDGRFCHATAINSDGEVVGEADTTEGIHAVVWRAYLLHDLMPLRYLSSRAVAINDDGFVLGVSEMQPNCGHVACLWTATGTVGPIWLDRLGITGDGVRAMNNAGQIAGQMAFDEERPPAAFLWHCGHVTDLTGRFVDGSTAESVNNFGQVAGHFTTLRQFDQAFFWSEHRMIDLGFGQARAINDHAMIAGLTYQGGGLPIACVWEDLQRREIPLLPGCVASESLSVNNSAEVCGTMTFADGGHTAFLWKREYVINLNDVIDSALGWNLQEARTINSSGQIAGWGFLEHRHHGYLLTPNDRAYTRASSKPAPRQGAERIEVPNIVTERSESSFQDMILQQILSEANQ